MGLTSVFLSGAGIVSAAVIADLVSTEIKDWTPRLTERLIRHAGKCLPKGDIRERFLEELESHVSETPGHLGKIWVALDARRGAQKIVRAACGDANAWAEKFLDYIAFQGARLVQRSLLRVLENDLEKRMQPEQTHAVLQLVRSRFEPQLRDILRSELPHVAGYREMASEVQSTFAKVLSDLTSEVQQHGQIRPLDSTEHAVLTTSAEDPPGASANRGPDCGD